MKTAFFIEGDRFDRDAALDTYPGMNRRFCQMIFKNAAIDLIAIDWQKIAGAKFVIK